ncbi:TonB-dependent receptor [Saccharicrinis sp. GN24d3]|uniref:TonB-dependent receptor n=1 Tax=Saccharicrinis sp. GN24d3 TaxID=3458416 RepID=UPI004035E79A
MKKNECFFWERIIPRLQKTARIMNLTIFLFLFSVVSVFAADSYSQTTVLTVDMQNTSVKEVLHHIEQQSEFYFMYSEKIVDVKREVSLKLMNKKVTDVLDALFRDSEVDYKVKDRFILLTNSELSNYTLFAQDQGIITGKVTDDTGQPLPGVTVVVKGTTNGAITDINGNYSISGLNSDNTLVFSFIGMVAQEIVVGDRSTINVVMVADAIGLEEVVAIGYGTRKKSDLTGAVSSVNNEYLKEQPVADVTKALQGSTSGIRVIRSATPGAEADIRIRGMGTINNNQPLWVVDGVVGANPPAPNQIESVEVLKDASSTAIYGSRGASGVILVTTKGGRINQAPKMEISVRSGFSAPDSKFDVMTNPQLLGELKWLEMQNDGLTPSDTHFGSGNAPVLNYYLFPNGASAGDASADLSLYDQNNYPITRSNPNGTDWMDAIYQNGSIQDFNLSVTGGSEKTKYAFAASYLEEEGILKYTSFQRLSIRSNIDTKLTDWLTIGQRLGATYGQKNGYQSNNYRENLINRTYMASPLVPIRDVAGNYAGSVVGDIGVWQNPLADLDRNSDDKIKDYSVTGNFYVELQPIKDLKYKSLLGYDVQLTNVFNPRFPEPEFIQGVDMTTLSESSRNNTLWNWTNTLTYEKTIGAHSFDVLLGVEATKKTYRDMTASRQDYFSVDPNFLVLDAGAQSQLNEGTGYAWTLFSAFGRLHYTYNHKYLFDFTLRRDGSSRFGENNRYGIFPAIAAGWVLSEEAFLDGTEGWLDYLKFRASWGQSGNDQIGNYNSYSSYSSNPGNSYYAISGEDNIISQGYQLSAIGNPDAKWETTTSSNIAFDATFMGGLDFSIDIWQKKTEDMLFPIAIPLVAGSATAPSVNIGTMKNTGLDITLGYNKIVNEDLSFNATATVSHYKNEVEKLSGNEDEFIQGTDLRGQIYTRTEPGRAFPEYYGYIIDGIFQTQAEADAHPVNGTYNEPGNLIVRDIAGATDANGNPIPDGQITAADRTYIGSPHPDFTTSLRLGMNYKNFDFSASLYASVGNDLVNYTNRYVKYGLFLAPNSKERLFNSWGSPYLNGDNSKATMPKASGKDNLFDQNASTLYIEDGSFLRLQNVQLGYTLPKTITEKIKLQNVRLYVMGANLFTITGYSGLDPEVIPGNGDEINMGVDIGSWPVSRQFMFGIDITL